MNLEINQFIDSLHECDFVYKNNQLFFRGKRLENLSSRTAGARYIFVLTVTDSLRFVVKVSPTNYQNKKEIEKYKQISRADSYFFPKIYKYFTISHDILKNVSILIENYIEFENRLPSEKEKNLVKMLAEKYNITDILITNYRLEDECNWAIDKKTFLPVIFDFGL